MPRRANRKLLFNSEIELSVRARRKTVRGARNIPDENMDDQVRNNGKNEVPDR